MKKILLFCLILVSILFINIEKVNAEEYKVGDLVEVINSSGGETIKFYITGEDEGYTLESKNAIINSSLSELDEGIYYIPQYLEDLEGVIKKQKYSLIQGFEFGGIESCLDIDSLESIGEAGINVNCPSYMKNYDNVFISSDSRVSIFFMQQVNGNFLVKKLTASSFDELDKKIGKKMNFYLGLFVSKENSNIMRKVDFSQENANDIQTTILNNKLNVVSNPKTNDINSLLIGASILIVGFITIVGIKKIKKLSK